MLPQAMIVVDLAVITLFFGFVALREGRPIARLAVR